MTKFSLFLALILAFPAIRARAQGNENEGTTLTQPADPPDDAASPSDEAASPSEDAAPPAEDAAHPAEEAAPPSENAAAPASEDAPSDENAQEGGEDKESAPPPPREMTLDDAGFNFQSVVEAFVAARSPKGYWPLREKATKKVLRLKLDSVDLKSVHKEDKDLYAGNAVLAVTEGDRRIGAEFTVDFSGEQWKVVKMVMLKGDAAKPAAGEDEGGSE